MKLLLALLLVCSPVLRAAEPFLKPNDVIALVGGEDMVAAAEYGYLELLLQRALPEHRLKVRSLAWEGDTVFEQPRDLNYPSLEAQLDEIGATVVIMQFGQMESLAGTSKLPEFIKAYEKLIERVGAGGKRRCIIIPPLHFAMEHKIGLGFESEREARMFEVDEANRPYWFAIKELAEKSGALELPASRVLPMDEKLQRDYCHFTEWGHFFWARYLQELWEPFLASEDLFPGHVITKENEKEFQRFTDARERASEPLLTAIRAKNRLWFHYYRPQNWAFLAGDRTEQPSSRDHKDPSKRWFPEEMKQWLGLIDAKEKEIWALAAKAAKP